MSLKNRSIILSILVVFLLVACQTKEIALFEEIDEIVSFEKDYEPTFIQSGKEDGFIELLMQYSIYSIDSLSFQDLESSIATNENFKEGDYYLNIEVDDYLIDNRLDILNMEKSSLSSNQSDINYSIYLLADKQTFIICKIFP